MVKQRVELLFMTSRYAYDLVANGIQIALSNKLIWLVIPVLLVGHDYMKYFGQFLQVPTTLSAFATGGRGIGRQCPP